MYGLVGTGFTGCGKTILVGYFPRAKGVGTKVHAWNRARRVRIVQLCDIGASGARESSVAGDTSFGGQSSGSIRRRVFDDVFANRTSLHSAREAAACVVVAGFVFDSFGASTDGAVGL